MSKNLKMCPKSWKFLEKSVNQPKKRGRINPGLDLIRNCVAVQVHGAVQCTPTSTSTVPLSTRPGQLVRRGQPLLDQKGRTGGSLTVAP